MLHDLHTHGPNFEVYDDGMELAKAGEAEEYVHNVGGQLCAFLPVFSQNS